MAKNSAFNGYMARIFGTINLEPHLIKGQTMHGPGDIEGYAVPGMVGLGLEVGVRFCPVVVGLELLLLAYLFI
jgi:hypothetical protein